MLFILQMCFPAADAGRRPQQWHTFSHGATVLRRMPEKVPAPEGWASLTSRRLPPLQRGTSCRSPRPWLSPALVSEEALGRGLLWGPGAAHFTAALPTSPGWSRSDSRHPHRKSVPEVSGARAARTRSQWRSGTLVCDESSLHWDEVETSEGDETVAAVAVGLLFCSSGSRGRNNCPPRCPPAREEPRRVGRGCREVRFPKPFLFNSRVFSKMSKYSARTRTRIKVSCTRLYLSSLIFWMMMVLLI